MIFFMILLIQIIMSAYFTTLHKLVKHILSEVKKGVQKWQKN